ncbi:type IV pilus assembly protein FimV [Acinetobacter rathckeae]|uniref:type IV pilus assembly protein FimV n=1 Tax=Acinetobacter rathckeae TaxID=2605272 RepID=UPI0018A31DEE|nr:LysM peptidoglycan-binding domain-containing protein [Acinetobacter rathckeae]MBF7688459.1 LysM peptidoglycan-binding domain-containing protein [Acinetobacter rathckeae]MBF7695543.1 LysM peptidoglycan-binding domain-containing protein [Acinetobacter rathckeae]
MTLPQKFCLTALFTCFLAQTGHALVLGQPVIQSTKEQLLYMEVPYSEATNIKSIRVNIEDDDEVSKLGINSKDMGFVVRKNGANFGVIVVTSNKPIRSSRINFVLKVTESDMPYLKRINIPFKVNNAASETHNEEKTLSPVAISSNENNIKNKTTSKAIATDDTNNVIVNHNDDIKFIYKVKPQDTLWSISEKIATQTGERLDDIARKIKADNPNAFTRHNMNHIKSGVKINIWGSKHIQKALQDSVMIPTPATRKPAERSTDQLSEDIQKELLQTKARIRSLEHEIARLQREMKQRNAKFDVINGRINDLRQQIKQLNEKNSRS